MISSRPDIYLSSIMSNICDATQSANRLIMFTVYNQSTKHFFSNFLKIVTLAEIFNDRINLLMGDIASFYITINICPTKLKRGRTIFHS